VKYIYNNLPLMMATMGPKHMQGTGESLIIIVNSLVESVNTNTDVR
jgi:hypothetical protein